MLLCFYHSSYEHYVSLSYRCSCCIFIYSYWNSGTSDFFVLMLFVWQCTDYEYNFFTLTPTQPCWKPALLQLLGDFKCFPRTIARWMGLGSKPKSGCAPLMAASPRGRMGWRPLTPWWRHQMETFSSLLALCAGNSPVPVNSPHKGQWRRALMFSFAWIYDWVNNREAGDLRRHRGHYDVIVMPTGWPR